MKKLFFSSMLLGGLMMASCSDDVMEAPKQEEVLKTYAQKFTEKFGPIAADQDWNMAEGKSINVNGASRAAGDDLKIYAKYQGVYRLVAHFDDASQATYDFTSPKGVNEFIVTCGGQIQMVENGGTVDFSAMSRTYLPEVQNVFDVHASHTQFSKKDFNEVWNQLGGKNNNNGKGNMKDFQFYNNGVDGSVTVYPLYWPQAEEEYHVFGVYYKNEDGTKTHYPIYQSKVGNDLICLHGNKNQTEEIIDNKHEWSVKESQFTVKTKGFDVVLKNKAFGFYVDTYPTAADMKAGTNKISTWYGLSEDNPNGEKHMGLIKVAQVKLGGKTWYVLCVESEANPNGSSTAFKDIFFLVGVDTPSVITEDPQAYILAVEDLGIDDDYDFNDIVFSISHVTGKTEATIQALAAGGTLPAQLYRGTEKIGGEFHSWFGAASNKMINTTSGEWVEGKEITITVPADFKMQSNAPETMMGGFKVVVTKDGGALTSIAAPGEGSAPQMICVPADWTWMKERYEIDKAYPMFGEYGQGYATTNWLEDANIDTSYLYDANNAN